MAIIEITCRACASALVTTNVDEVKAWNERHDEHCSGPVPRVVQMEVDGIGGSAVLPQGMEP